MTKASRWGAAAGLAVLCGVAGCDWESGGSADTTSNRYDWVNFSGVYRAGSGGFLISDYTVSPGTSGQTNNVVGERIGTTQAGVSAYSGTLGRRPILARTVQITAGVFVLQDNGTGGLTGSGKTGSINYSTGAWAIDLLGEFPPAGTAITANYQFTVAATAGAGGPGTGASGRPIYTFTVVQNGNNLTITDNNGATYTGKFGSIRTTGGVSRNTPLDTQTPSSGDTVLGDFNIKGTSAAGRSVEMVGTFQATITVATSTTQTQAMQVTLNSRRMFGTWIEKPGRTGNIDGVAASVTTMTTTTTGGP